MGLRTPTKDKDAGVAMGWEKVIEADTGVSVGFWQLKSMQVNLETLDARVVVFGFLNNAAFSAGKAPIGESTIEVNLADVIGDGAAASLIGGLESKIQEEQDGGA